MGEQIIHFNFLDRVAKPILELLQDMIPKVSQLEIPLPIRTLEDRIIKNLAESKNVEWSGEDPDVSEDAIRGFIEGVLQAMVFLGVLSKTRLLISDAVQCLSFESQALMRSWLEYLRTDTSFFDWEDDDKEEVTRRLQFLKACETNRLERSLVNDKRAIWVFNIAEALIKGYSPVFHKSVFLFRKTVQTDALGRDVSKWVSIRGSFEVLDNFRPQGFIDIRTMKDCLRKSLNRRLNVMDSEYEVVDIPNAYYPKEKRISDTHFQFTEFRYHPFSIRFRDDVSVPNIFSTSAAGTCRWLTLDFLLTDYPKLDGAEVSNVVFKQLQEVVGQDWEKEIEDSFSSPIPYQLVKHVNNDLHLSKDLFLRLDSYTLFSTDRPGFEKSISQTAFFFLLILLENKPSSVPYEDIRKRVGCTDIRAVWRLKYDVTKDLGEEFGKEYIKTHSGFGYSLVD